MLIKKSGKQELNFVLTQKQRNCMWANFGHKRTDVCILEWSFHNTIQTTFLSVILFVVCVI